MATSSCVRNIVIFLLIGGNTVCSPQNTQPPRPTLVGTADGRVGSGLNPSYLNAFPSAETVKKLIQGSDPIDTLARQVAVFNILQERIRRHIATDKSRPFRATPDENNVIYVYSYAAWEIEEGYKKTHTKEEATAFMQRHWKYESNWDMDKEIDSKLLSASAVAEDRANVKTMYQQLEEHNEAILRQNEEYKRRAAAAAADPHGRMVMDNDPTARAVRRCLELGGNQLECVGKSFGKGLMAMFGVNTDVLFGKKGRSGLAIGGIYNGANGIWMGFDEITAGINGCGELKTAGGGYTLTQRGTSYVIQVLQQPRPFTMVLGPDGNITGPGPIDVQGLVVVGYQHYTETTRRTSDWVVVGSRDVTEPVYGPKVVRCNIGPLRNSGPMAAGDMANLFTTMFAAMGDKSAQQQVRTYPSGIRMLGSFAATGGLKILFALEGATLDCGEAHVARQYTVETTASAVRVIIDNGGTPLAVTLQTDGSLAGSGTVDVAGRLMTGMSGNEIIFKPVHASCPIGTLAPADH